MDYMQGRGDYQPRFPDWVTVAQSFQWRVLMGLQVQELFLEHRSFDLQRPFHSSMAISYRAGQTRPKNIKEQQEGNCYQGNSYLIFQELIRKEVEKEDTF